jgi:hypothetical protein
LRDFSSIVRSSSRWRLSLSIVATKPRPRPQVTGDADVVEDGQVGKRRMFWKVRDIPHEAILCGFMPARIAPREAESSRCPTGTRL